MTSLSSPLFTLSLGTLASFSLVSLSGAAGADSPSLATGFELPESVLVLPETGQIVVSNMKDSPVAQDGNGYLSLLAPDGTVIEKEWAAGLDAPKGMAMLGNTLIVADLNQVHIIDTKDGSLVESIAAADAGMLNDVTTDASGAWISDFFSHKIYRYEDGSISVFMEGGALTHPNGVLYEDGQLIVGNWGTNMKDDFSTDAPGGLLSIDVDTKEVTELTAPFANIDGIVRLGEALVVNDWITGKIYSVAESGDIAEIAQYHTGLADIGAFENTLYLPFMLDGDVKTLTP